MPIFADFYFYKNTPMDKNEVNFFNTGESNNIMKDELLHRLRDYQVGEEYNSKVPFNPTAGEIYINAPPGVSVSIEDMLAINYMIVRAWDLHNRVTQEYKYFAFFVDSVEPYIQTFPTDGLEDTGVRNAFGYSYRVKIKKDTFVTDFIFLNKAMTLSELRICNPIINVLTPFDGYNKYNLSSYGTTEYRIGDYPVISWRNGKISTVVKRAADDGTRKIDNDEVKLNCDFLEFDENAENYITCGVYVSSETQESRVNQVDSFFAIMDRTYTPASGGILHYRPTTLKNAIKDALDFMQIDRVDKTTTSTQDYVFVELKSVYIIPYFIAEKIIPYVSQNQYGFYAKSSSSTVYKKFEGGKLENAAGLSDILCGEFSLTEKLNAEKNGYFGFEALNAKIVAGRKRIEAPQIIFEKYGRFVQDKTETKIIFSGNAFGISIELEACGQKIDVTEEYSLPVISAAAADVVQREIAKTSTLLSGIISVLGGVATAAGGFASGNLPAGIAGVGAVVGGATNIIKSETTPTDTPGALSVSSGAADAVSALINGFVRIEYCSCVNSASVFNSISKFGYSFDGHVQDDYIEPFYGDKDNNFLYAEISAERIFDPSGYIPETFKTWLLEKLKTGVRFFYSFDNFFDKNREGVKYFKE